MEKNVFAYERKRLGLTQEQLAKKLNTSRSNVANWENGFNQPSVDLLFKCSNLFGCDIMYLVGYQDERIKLNDNDIPEPKYTGDIEFDNCDPFIHKITLSIPVLGIIKAGIPIEAQSDILEYVDIPISWTKGDKVFYGLKISGDSMYPKYNNNDIVIFEQTSDYHQANGKDCAVMVNGDDATFKKVFLDESGVTLQPYNNEYPAMRFTNEQIESKPVKIIGIAKEKRTRL